MPDSLISKSYTSLTSQWEDSYEINYTGKSQHSNMRSYEKQASFQV